MSKCTKVKNPCKICLGAVNQRNGLQCCGACESWVHYGCLNYTPGRIKDIKAGIIKVTCPCPDCKTSQPKEYRTDEPFSCTNMQCPANKPPQCGNHECPVSNPMGRGGADRMLQTSGYNMSPCPLSKCGRDCKQHSSPMLLNSGMGQMQPCAPKPPPMPMASSSDACLDVKCPSGCIPSRGVPSMSIPGDVARPPEMTSMCAMEQMCTTVGILSKQINELMIKMQTKGQGGQPPCTQRGPKSLCPKPCFCPGNPGQ